MNTDIVWHPSDSLVEQANLTAFIRHLGLSSYDALLERSNADPSWYWDTVIRHFDIRFSRPYTKVMDSSAGAPWTVWCVDGETNIAANCLDRHADSDKEAIVWEAEDGTVRRWTYRTLHAESRRLAAGLRSLGLGRGDVIGLLMPLQPETVAAFFAVARIGAVVAPLFSGFGPEASAARLNDAEAKALICADGTHRRGKVADLKAVADATAERVPSLAHVVVLRSLGNAIAWNPARDRWWHDLVRDQSDDLPAEPMAADSPFMLIYTSGTTGRAKGTVHTHCGFLAKLASDFGLTLDFKPTDRMMWMSDMGWVVGPMQATVSAFFGATVVMAEGTPDWPAEDRLWAMVARHRITYLGLAPTIARALMRHGAAPVLKHDLSSLRITVSSGEPWNPDSWTWFMETVCRGRVPILNVSGGTEIGWGIVSSTPLHAARPCSFAGPCLASGAAIVDQQGNPVAPGEVGELVLTVPSIGLSRGLWKDPERYLDSYWRRLPGLWVHGDWASTDADGLWYIHGRSDDTIKLAGKRTGPAEIEALLLATGLIAEAAAVGLNDPLKGQAVACVCVPRDGPGPDEGELAARLSAALVEGMGAPYRPKRILFVGQLPKTRSQKVMRRVVRAALEGGDPGDLASLVNPEAMEELLMKARNE